MEFLNFLLLGAIGFGSFMVICFRNPLYSVLSLILVFLLSAILLFSLEAEFLGLSFVLIYVGAIAILFLFIVVMLDIKVGIAPIDLGIFNTFLFLIFFTILLEILISFSGLDLDYNLTSRTDYTWLNWFFEINHFSNAQMFGQILYTYYFFFFLIGGFILFIALIGSLMLVVTLNKSYKIN